MQPLVSDIYKVESHSFYHFDFIAENSVLQAVLTQKP